MRQILRVENLKCGGCANTVYKTLGAETDVTELDVKVESGEISFESGPDTDMAKIKNLLAGLGYPEAGTSEGLNKIVGVAKSYVSCAIGKLSKS